MLIKSKLLHKHSDVIGAISSFMCTIHCLATPLIFISKPMIYRGGLIQVHSHSHLWAYLDVLFMIIGFAAVYLSVQHSTKKWIKISLYLAWGIFAGGLILEMNGNNGATWILISGSVLLVFFHLYNRHYCLIDQCHTL
ncbi:MAG TPA: MerC domain-containing protein [Saprospiraceae bacterium]|nr:MerC domain-containing protein [Saprospiraceae bacterium]